MKIALSEISTVGASFADDVAAYAAAGFDGIGIWEFKLPDGDDAESLHRLRESGLGAGSGYLVAHELTKAPLHRRVADRVPAAIGKLRERLPL